MSEQRKIGYRYFYSSCIGILLFILLFIFNYVGPHYMMLIIGDLLAILAISWFIKKKSDKLTQHFEIRTYLRESGNLSAAQGGKSKKILTYRNIIIERIRLSIWLFVTYFSIGIFGCLVIFFHEIGHLLTAISFKVDIIGFFLSPLRGYVNVNGEIPDMQYTIIALTGGLGVAITGTFFLLLLHWNDDLTITFQIPLIFIIMYAIWDSLSGFWNGAISLSNIYDIGQILQRNPDLNPSLILYFCLFWWALVIIFSVWSLLKKITNKTRVVINVIFPDLSLFAIQRPSKQVIN